MSKDEACPESTDAESAPPPSPVAEEDALSDADVAELRRTTQVINKFYGNVDAGSTQFGVSLGVTHRRATGPVDEAQVRQAHEHFVASPRHSDAARILVQENLVLLAGPENTGRTTSAIVLLHLALDDPHAPLVSLSPAMSLAQLVEYPHFKRNRGYLVRDWVDDAQPDAVQQFEVAQLSNRLQKHGAYLVLVTESARIQRLTTSAVKWEPPAPEAMFDEYAPPQPDTRARAHAVELNSPAEVVAFARNLSYGLETALVRLDGSTAKQVTEWFDSKPERLKTLEAAALAFAHGLPDRTFEAVFERLLRIAGPVPIDVPGESAIRQSRADRSDHPLISTTLDVPGPDGLAGERRLVFRSVEHRARVIAELVERYGFELWDPIRTWLHELVSEPPLSELHFQMALGISLLSRNSPREAEQDYLFRWADGTSVTRLTAAHVLTWMCIDDSLAPQALRIALSWATNAGTRRAMTAATALGGEIGARYPSDAMRVLWFLAARSQRIGDIARVSLGLLFSAAVENAADASWVLNLLRSLARQSIGNGNEFRRIQLSKRALLSVLSGNCGSSEEAITAHVLRRQPASMHALGEIWGWVLCSGSHRGRAIEALRHALQALAAHDGTLPIIAELGNAIRTRMPAPQLELLHRDLRFALTKTDQAVASTFLSSLDRHQHAITT
ncbi:hypothetical protein AB0I53_44395 [Saccharopolyspora sp. NPDC050389]|uniref:hypothetical protein n=1 Tax=Saccharopolyspora sp. NPDC050389 TaxID=3155516 RepID=UPI00341191A2